MTKHEADVIGGLNMTDQISNEAYKQIMIAARDEKEVADVLDKIRAEIEQIYQEIDTASHNEYENAVEQGKEIAYENVLEIIDKYKAESED